MGFMPVLLPAILLRRKLIVTGHVFDAYIKRPHPGSLPMFLLDLLRVWRSHNSPAHRCPNKILSNGTTGSGLLSLDFGLREHGKGIQLTVHSAPGNINNFGASSMLAKCMPC